MTCTHWWVIATPTAPTSSARCKRCGAERVFANWEPQEYSMPITKGSAKTHRKRKMNDRISRDVAEASKREEVMPNAQH